ncbi:MAG: Methyltransferase type 12 [Thermoleophilia bacterium]|nr:Methyltransferase type 12 [Thermoleophilia bacterium]
MDDRAGIEGGTAYEELDELYDVWCAEVVEDVGFYVGLADRLAADVGRDVLDVIELGAGSGRITIPLAHAGHRVTAIDAAPRQLERLTARTRAERLDELVTPVVGDMRELDTLVAAESADLVLVPFRGMLHVTPERDAVLAAAARALRPGGAVAFDVFHPTAEQVGVTHGRWIHRREELTRGGRWRFQERARYLPELAAEPGGLKLEVDVRCRWRSSRRGRRLEALPLADPPADATERTTLLELQLVPAERWADSLLRAGFTVDGSYGWFDARPLGRDDDDSIWVARRG